MGNVKHSSVTVEHYTPPLYRNLAVQAMGSMTLDAASCLLAQTLTPFSERFYGVEDDGLSLPWFGNVFVNPPGGMRSGQSNMRLWFHKAFTEWYEGRIKQCIFLGFQLSILRLNPEIFELSLPFVVPQQRIRFWTTPECLLLPYLVKYYKRRTAEYMLAALPEGWLSWDHVELMGWSGLGEYAELDKLQAYFTKCRKAEQWVKSEHGILLPSRSPSHDNAVIYLPDREDAGATQRFYSVFSKVASVPQADLCMEAVA